MEKAGIGYSAARPMNALKTNVVRLLPRRVKAPASWLWL